MNKHSADATTAEEAIAIQSALDSDMATEVAMQDTLLTPRFYTTNFDELDAIDVSQISEEWQPLIERMLSDPNKGHFKKNDDWDKVDWEGMEPQLKKEFIDFLISSCTAEFSGCVLYKEMKRRGSNKDITQLFQLMARDEARHAGFINDALREAGVAVNLGFLTQKKKYTYFRPKFIYYATYLSEKIGYARYITIYRHLEKNPQHRFHPIFKWLHVVAGIMWIGLLYFFNFVNTAFAPTMDGDTKKKVVPELMPRTLYWFRMGAAWTWGTGIVLLYVIYWAGGMMPENFTSNEITGEPANMSIHILLLFTFVAVSSMMLFIKVH